MVAISSPQTKREKLHTNHCKSRPCGNILRSKSTADRYAFSHTYTRPETNWAQAQISHPSTFSFLFYHSAVPFFHLSSMSCQSEVRVTAQDEKQSTLQSATYPVRLFGTWGILVALAVISHVEISLTSRRATQQWSFICVSSILP